MPFEIRQLKFQITIPGTIILLPQVTMVTGKSECETLKIMNTQYSIRASLS